MDPDEGEETEKDDLITAEEGLEELSDEGLETEE